MPAQRFSCCSIAPTAVEASAVDPNMTNYGGLLSTNRANMNIEQMQHGRLTILQTHQTSWRKQSACRPKGLSHVEREYKPAVEKLHVTIVTVSGM
jgi:hypothetical protein